MKAKTSKLFEQIINDNSEVAKQIASFMRSEDTYQTIKFNDKIYTVSKIPYYKKTQHILATIKSFFKIRKY